LTQICIKSFVGWGFATDPTGGAYSAPPDPLAGLGGGAPGKGKDGGGKDGGEGREPRNAHIQSWQAYILSINIAQQNKKNYKLLIRCCGNHWWMPIFPPGLVKVKVHTPDVEPLHSESPLQKCSGMARVLKGCHSFTCTPTLSSTIGISHTCLCLPSYSW